VAQEEVDSSYLFGKFLQPPAFRSTGKAGPIARGRFREPF
jgi:hypothetical protein